MFTYNVYNNLLGYVGKGTKESYALELSSIMGDGVTNTNVGYLAFLQPVFSGHLAIFEGMPFDDIMLIEAMTAKGYPGCFETNFTYTVQPDAATPWQPSTLDCMTLNIPPPDKLPPPLPLQTDYDGAPRPSKVSGNVTVGAEQCL
jgi:hypothetical protein